MSQTTTVKYYTEEDEEVELELPAKMRVCGDCEGHGYVLCEGMREHAYSAEEFYDSFDEEEREEYFKRGGRYDVICPTCKGKNVVPVVDKSRLSPEQKTEYDKYLKYQEEMDRFDAECRAEERMERLMGC